MPTECERSVTSSVTTKISASNEIKDNNSTITTTTTTTTSSSISFNEDLQTTSTTMMEGGDMSTSQTSTTSNGSSSCNGGGRKTSIRSPDPTAYVAKARVTRPTPPPPPYNPMQFVQIKPCNLYQTAQEQLKKAEEVKKIKEIRKEEPEDWQNNLDNWKSSRRKRVEHIIDRVVEVKKLELEEHDRTRRKSKTFSEMIEERGERAGGRGLNKLVSLAVYAEDESNDLSDLGIGTSSASGKSSLSEDYDNNSVMSDNAAELDKAITNSTHHKPATDSTTREYISSPGYETSSSTAPASSPDPCEYTYEGAIQDYKQRVSRAASGLTAVALNKLTQHNQTQQNSKESTPERGVVKETTTTTVVGAAAAYPPRRGSKIEDRLMGFEVQSPSSEECVEKSKVDVPKIDISKRKEIFEQQQQQLQQQQQQALQINEPKSSQLLGHQSNTTVVVPRVTLRDRFKVQQDTRTEKSVTEQPKKELKRLSGDITSIKERLQSLEQQQNLVNGGANGAIKATANKLVEIPVPPLKERLSSLQNAVTKEEIRKPPVVLVDARQLEIMKVEEEKAQQSLKETKEKEKIKEKQPQSEAVTTTITQQQLQKETNKIVTEEPEETDRDDSGIHTADDVELDEQQQQRLQADQLMKKEQELKLNAAIEALAKEEQQLSEAANVVNQIEAEFEELTLASVATLPPLAGTAANTTAASSSSASASATPITNDHMEYSINEALELALAAIDKETIPLTAAIQQQPPPPLPPPQQLQPQPENLYPITAPSSNTYDNDNSSSTTTTTTNNNNSNNLNNICNNNNNNNNKSNNNNNKQVVPPTEDILLNKTDEEKYEKLNLDIKLEEKSEEEISQEPIYENIITTTNNSTASIKEVDVALMMSTTTKKTTTIETETNATTVAYQQQQPQIIPSMIMMMHHNTDDDHNNTDQQHNNNNNNNNDNDVRIVNDNKSSSSNNYNNHNNIIKPLQIENQNSKQNLSTLTSAASATATAVTVTTMALASKQLKNSQINKINNNNNNSNNINNIVVANDNNYNHHNNNNNNNTDNTDNKMFNKQNLNDLTNAFANTTITTTTTNNAITTQQNISTTTTTTVNHKPNNNTNTNSCSTTTTTKLTSSSTIHLKELNFNQQTPLMMTTAAIQQQQPSDLNKPEQQQQHLQQQHLNDDNNSEPYYQVPKSNEPYYDAPKHLKPIPVYENIEVFFNGNSLNSTDLNSHLQPPKEKPPPPPVDSPPLFDDVDSSSHTDTWSSDNTYETLTRHQNNHNHSHHHHHLSPDQPSPPIKRMNSTKRIKKELRHKRSSFLGIEGSSLDDDESYLELTVAPPPDMAQLLQEERRLEKQLYLKAGLCDSSDTGESRDSGVSENHSRQSSEHYTNSSEENEPHDDTTSPLTLQTQTDTQSNDMIYQNDGLLAVVPTPLLQTVKGNSAESWTESATVAAAATQSLTEATATANAKMMSIEEKIREQEEVLRVERELLQLEQEELKRQRENLMLRENMARRELQHGAKMLMSANRRSLQDLNGLGAMTVVNIQNESQIPANGLEMYHHQMHPGLQAAQGQQQQHMMSSQPQLAQPQQLQQQANKPQQIYANIPNLQQQYYHMETDYRKSMSDINEFSKRMMSQPPAPPSKPMRAMHTNNTSNANGGVMHNVEPNDYTARQRHSLNTQNFGGSLVKIAAAPTAAPRTAAHIYSNYQHQSVQNLAPPTSTGHQQVLTTANQSLYPGNMSRNTLHALSATPKPKYTDGWVQVQQRKSYDSNLANDPAWLSAYQQKRKSMPDANYHGYNQNNHWLIQEAEQRRLNEQQQQQQQQQQRRTISSNNTPLHQMNNSSNSIKMTNGSSTVLSTATATTNGKPLPDSIIQTLTERVQSKGIGERKRTNLDKSPLHAASTYHHYQQQQQQQYNKLNQTQQQFSSNTAIHRHNNIITTLSSTATAIASTATSSMAATTANGQSNITTITQQQQQQQQQQHQQQQQDKVLSVSGKKKCSHCGDELGRGAAMIIESLLLFYHINCFKCCVCHVQLGDGLNGTDVRVRNHKLHCQNCYSSDDGIKFSCV